MPTLADYKAAVTTKGYEAVTTAPAIVAAINAARRRVARAHRWTFMEAEDSALTTTPSQSFVTLGGTWLIDAVRLRLSVTDAWDLEYREPEELRRLNTEDATSARPMFWSKRAGKLLLYPIPDRSYTVNVDYVIGSVAPLVVDADADATLINDVTLDAVAWAAAKELSFRMRDYNAMQAAEGQYQAEMAVAVRADNTAQRQAARQVQSNPNRWDAWNAG